MKALRLITFLFLLTGSTAYAQINTVTLYISGMIHDTVTGLPVPGHQVVVTVRPDSIYTFAPIIDSAVTSNTGIYSLTILSPWYPGTALPLTVSTLDCQNYQFSQSFYYTGNGNYFSAYFSICTDSIPPSLCDNYILLNGLQQLTASFHGGMVNPQSSANYNWDFGDGTSGYGPDVTHTFPSAGSYTVQLSTITNDSCFDISQFPLFLGDTIPYNCFNWFDYTSPPASLLVYFQGYTMSSNPSTFSWSFGDPASGTNNTSDLQNPIHEFSNSGIYIVQLLTTDATGCTYFSSQPVNVESIIITDTLGITGTIYGDSIPRPLQHAQLYKADSYGVYTPIMASWYPMGNAYYFNNIGTGDYLVLGFSDEAINLTSPYLPTYYGDVIFWEEATVITLGFPQNPYDIHLVSYDSIGGGIGGVNGQIIQGGGKSVSMANREVVLLDNSGIPVRFTYTDADGNFNFSSLPLGNYQVHPNITGITAFPVEVVLDPENTHTTVIMTIVGNTITGITEKPSSHVIRTLYPNPVISEIELTVKNGIEGRLNATVLDAYGRNVIQQLLGNAGETESFRIDVESLAPGLYFLRVNDAKGNSSTQKFIKR